MEVTLTAAESEAISKALRSYLSDLRAEIVDTDNPQYKRDLRDERAALEAAVAKLDEAGRSHGEAVPKELRTVRIVEMWWSPEEH